MNIGLQGSETVVNRLRLNATTSDPGLATMRLASLLRDAPLHPAGLAPAAIVFIRKMYDPRPGSLRLDQSGGHLPAAWDQAAKELLERLVSNASRPAREAVAPSAQAVAFLDRSELLASFASDWCEGVLTARWWWQSFLKQGTASQIVRELWRRDPQYVPAALQQLAIRKRAVDFVRTFDDSEVHSVLSGVARSFALHSLIPVLDDLTSPTNAGPAPQDVNQPKDLNSQDIVAGRAYDQDLKTRVEAPWFPWVPECGAAGLRPAQEFFLGVVLMLQRAPVKVRAANFQIKVGAWQQEISAAQEPNFVAGLSDALVLETTDKKPRSNSATPLFHLAEAQLIESLPSAVEVADKSLLSGTAALPKPETRKSPATARSAFEFTDAVVVAKGGNGELRAKQVKGRVQQRDLNASPPNAELPTTLPAGKSDLEPLAMSHEQLDSLEPREVNPDQITQTSQTNPAQPAAAHTSDEKPLSPDEVALLPTLETISRETGATEEWIETQLGGLFFLINLGIVLGLYGDFTSPGEPGLELNIWDFLSLIGSELVAEQLQSDPVWALLARLAQREEEDLPGSGFEPKDEWRLPLEWLQPFAKESPGPWRWSASVARLRLFHPEGFVVLDLQRDALPESSLNMSNSATQLERELQTYESLELRVSNFELGENSALEKEFETRNSKLETWIKWLLPYVRARLVKAFGLTEPADPGPFLCRQQSRICVTPTHIDLFFSLARLPIEIRIAGLDRDPGWVPAAGKFIAFHFE